MTATILSAMPMRDLTKLAYSQHRDAPAAYDEMQRRMTPAFFAERHDGAVASLLRGAQ